MIGDSEKTTVSTAPGNGELPEAALPETEASSPHLVTTQLHNLQETRREETVRQIRSMVVLSFTFVIAGATVGIVGCVLGEDANDEGTFLLRSWSSTSYVGGCAGLMVLGTFPMEEMDKASITSLGPRQRVGLGTGWALVNSMFAVNYPPHAHILGIVAGLLLAVTAATPEFEKWKCGEPCRFRSGGFMMVWFALFLISHGLMHMWVGGVDGTDPIMTLAIPVEWQLVIASVHLLGAIALVLMWLWRHSNSGSEDPEEAQPLSLMEAVSLFLGPLCLGDIISGSLGCQHQLHSWISAALLVRGCAMALVSSVLWVLGYRGAYTCLMRALTQNPSDAQMDGEFIASLLDAKAVSRGQIWWTERDEGDFGRAKCSTIDEDADQSPRSPRPLPSIWRKGRIYSLDLENDQFVVEVFPDGVEEDWIAENFPECAQEPQGRRTSLRGPRRSSIFGGARSGGIDEIKVHPKSTMERLPMRMRAVPWQDLMTYATENLRCVEWADVTQDFLVDGAEAGARRPLREANREFAKSRPIRQGETIDFFVSHSWNDEASDKFSALEGIAGTFMTKHGRLPTLWIDRCCIDRRISLDGLRMLPVHVMSCKKVAVLFGPTYAGRLLCVWELFTLQALSNWKHASEKLYLVPLGGLAMTYESEYASTTSPAKSKATNTVSGLDELPRLKEAIAAGFRDFSMSVVSCYDPNEEHRLRQVIRTAGEQRFCARIKALADALETLFEEDLVGLPKKRKRAPNLRRLIGKRESRGESTKTASTEASQDREHTPTSATGDTSGGSPKSEREAPKQAEEDTAAGDRVAVASRVHFCKPEPPEDFPVKPAPLQSHHAEPEQHELEQHELPSAPQPAQATSKAAPPTGDESEKVSSSDPTTADAPRSAFTNFADSPQKATYQSDTSVNNPQLHVEVTSKSFCCSPVPINCEERSSTDGERSLATSLRICQAQSNKVVPS